MATPEDALNATVDASAAAATLTMERRAAVRDEFVWSWRAYEAHAWGRDELRPLSQTADDWVPGGMGLTILDSIGTNCSNRSARAPILGHAPCTYSYIQQLVNCIQMISLSHYMGQG